MNEKEQWVDYVFDPKKTLTTKELTDLLQHLFKIKPVSEQFHKDLPKSLQKHFTKRDRTTVEALKEK